MQVEIVSEEKFPMSILFNHAQDTLMSVMSEINLAGWLIRMYRIMRDHLPA